MITNELGQIAAPIAVHESILVHRIHHENHWHSYGVVLNRFLLPSGNNVYIAMENHHV